MKALYKHKSTGDLFAIETNAQGNVRYDFVYVDEESFKKYNPKTFKSLVDSFREYKE